ncbi:uncharacterized protein LOC135824719 [Sycon ciliatum]|uniref:uncharacterized protein LOC135824719 n=1 Tax=Sycon ciliatum TaxID=27933 RepID=UPI0031F6056B
MDSLPADSGSRAAGAANSPARLSIGEIEYDHSQIGDGGSVGAVTGIENFEAEFERKRLRLAEVEEDARQIRLDLAAKDDEIRLLREELGLTPLAQIKQAVTSSVPYQKTMEIGDRVASSEAYKKTQSTLSEVGTKTGELLKTAGAKTSDAFSQASQNLQESETLNDIGAKLRLASSRIKSSFSKESPESPSVSTPGIVEDVTEPTATD